MDQAAARFRHAVAEARTLERVQRVIAGVERIVLRLATPCYDTAPAVAVARSLKQAIEEKDTARVAECEDHMANELFLWRLDLGSRDQAIRPYDLRRFCESSEEALDAAVFSALTRFYRTLPYSEPAQIKYDFAITQLYTSAGEHTRRVLRFEGNPLIENISEMFTTWGEASGPAATDEETAAALNGFQALLSAAGETNEFEALITSGLFNELRILKSNLGRQLYRPEIAAAAIECNAYLGNKFCDLVALEGAEVDELPAAYRNLANILSDTSAISFVSGALNELQLAELEQKGQSGTHLARLMKLLRASNDHPETRSQATGIEQESPQSEDYCVPPELTSTLSALAEDDENKEIVADFLRTRLSEERRSLDPAIFLARLLEVVPGARDEERKARRLALALILNAERLLLAILDIDNPLTVEIESELSALLPQMQQTDSILRERIAEARAIPQLPLVDQLLHVSNHLLGARLSLQSALVARAAEELARQKALAEQKDVTPHKAERTHRPWRKLARYAAAAVVLIVFAGLSLRALTLRSTAGDQRDKDVQVLDIKEMPGASVIVGARQKGQILVVVVSSAWVSWPEDQKREQLEALAHYGEPLGVNTVMLVDSGGSQHGSIANSKVTLDSPAH